MSRARVAALVLVNWKGVFYERYLLDRHVTALEGANGAGKTTVMIAAYVVLLPDMARLRFTNLGESGATGGDRGIWGRLGEPGRPAYAALDLDLGGERVVLGVRLTRASEPTVELTAFIVTGLGAAHSLSELLLKRQLDGDHVPDLDEIKTLVGQAGASIEVFRATKDYFAALFERGITPLRLTAESERAKWNDLLRTSMTGGISRALGSDLRGFLLREESGLASTLSRMRENLEACRRTRLEVSESRQLEREISATFEAGQAMWNAALHAGRLADLEARQRLQLAVEQCERARGVVLDLKLQREQLSRQEAELVVSSERTRTAAAQLAAANERSAAADECGQRIAALEAELALLEEQARAARANQAAAAAAREAAKAARTRALDAYDRTSVGLVHLQQGLEELNRRAHDYRQLTRRLHEAAELLGRSDLMVEAAPAALAELEGASAELERERTQLERSARDLAARQKEHARALELLAELTESPLWLERDRRAGAASELAPAVVSGAQHAPLDTARALLAHCAQLELTCQELERIEREQAEAERLAAKQTSARQLAASLELELAAGAEVVALALASAEEELEQLETQLRARTPEERSPAAVLRGRLAELELESARYRSVHEIAARLGDPATFDSLTALLALRDGVTGQQLALEAESARLESEREALQLQAAELTRGGVVHDIELLRVRDELGAELLAGRFEDLDAGQASRVEARLGPLVHALVVDDPDAAAELLAGMEHALPSVHLVRAGALLELALSAEGGREPTLVCEEPYGLRVARVPEQSRLGRRAREQALSDLKESIEARTRDIERVTAERAHNAARRRDSELLLAAAELWFRGDPERQREPLERELAELTQREQQDRAAEREARARAQALRARIKALRKLLPEARLLEPPEHAERARELRQLWTKGRDAANELARTAAARAELSRLLDVLREPPPDEHAAAQLRERLTRLGGELERAARTRAALEEAHALRHAVEYRAAQEALAAQAALSPALEAQHNAARDELHASERADASAVEAWEAATALLQAAEAPLSAAAAHRDRALAELQQLGGRPSELDRERLRRELSEAHEELRQLEAATRTCLGERARIEDRHERAQAELAIAEERRSAEADAAQPLAHAWRQLRQAADAAGVLHTALASAPGSAHSSVQLRADAVSKRQLLLDRVARTRGSEELTHALSAAENDGPGYLEAWLAVRAWLGRRVPAHVAEVMDPLLALERLRDHLTMLETRLTRHEGDLRGSSDDVARGIEVQLRRAHGQVRRLNQQLEGIQFGSIHGIRIELRRIERMDQILRALREGQAQDLLFSAALPIEEALDEIFKRYAGGGRGAGQRLLDYREYVELAVEVRRQAAAAWEPANPTRLSTGEAIGVGAALMMVVLTQWEWDANMLRPRGTLGSLRFLFLDEANRLSRDNLGVLFDLCRSLELQLLVAAPEVARADGNTTYRLVRHTTEAGHEEVIVSGRRAVAATLEQAPSEEVPSTEAAPEQAPAEEMPLEAAPSEEPPFDQASAEGSPSPCAGE